MLQPAPEGTQMMQVAVPDGLTPGAPFLIQTPDGQQMQITVPEGNKGGDLIAVPVNMPTPVVDATPVPLRGPEPVPGQSIQNANPGCCDPGGCCNPAPPRQTLNEDGTVGILRVPYREAGCCEKSTPFAEADTKTVPSQLQEAGVTETEWALWTQKLYTQVNLLKSPKCGLGCWCAIALGLMTFFTICPMLCAAQKKEIMAWDAAFRKWQEEFNAQVLLPKGIFCKSQSLCWVTRGPKGEKQRHYHRWIAFAFGPGITTLQAQPHLQGDIESGCCGGSQRA